MKNYLYRMMSLGAGYQEERESWLCDMARNGWQLCSTGKLFRLYKFEKCEPKNTRYRCDVFERNNASGEKRLHRHEQAGWGYVASDEYIQIFRTDDPTVPEINMSYEEQQETAAILRKRQWMDYLAAAGPTVLLISIIINNIHDYPAAFCQDNMWWYLIIMYGYFFQMFLSNALQTSKQLKKLKNHENYNHDIEYRAKFFKRKLVNISFFALLILLYIMKPL